MFQIRILQFGQKAASLNGNGTTSDDPGDSRGARWLRWNSVTKLRRPRRIDGAGYDRAASLRPIGPARLPRSSFEWVDEAT